MDVTNSNRGICLNCSTELAGPICHQCGQQVMGERWSTGVLVGQFLNHITNIERGFLYTARALFTAPGRVVSDYWRGKTVRYYHPFRFVIIWTAITILINLWLGFDDLLQAQLQPESLEHTFGSERVADADRSFDSWLNILVLLLIPFNSFVSRLMFKRHGQNYAEHLILNSYILGQQGLMGSVSQLLFFTIPALFVWFIPFNFLVGWAYSTYVFKQTFKESLGLTLLKALAYGLVSMVVYFGLVAAFSAVALALS